MKNCMRKLAPVFNTNRMVRDYAERMYVPALLRGQNLAAEGLRRSIDLAHAKDRLRQKWNGVKVVGVHANGNGHFKVGQSVQVEALVDMPELKPDEIDVQLYAGPLNAAGDFDAAGAVQMTHSREMGPNRHLFVGKLECKTSGRQGFAVRVVPGNDDLATPFEPGLIVWN
jgi:starch phosphorylase